MDSIAMTKTRPAAVPAPAVPSLLRQPSPLATCSSVGAAARLQAPTTALHGTGLPFAGSSEQYGVVLTGTVAPVFVRSNDLPVLPPRGALV